MFVMSEAQRRAEAAAALRFGLAVLIVAPPADRAFLLAHVGRQRRQQERAVGGPGRTRPAPCAA